MDGIIPKAKKLDGKTASGRFGVFLNITYGCFNRHLIMFLRELMVGVNQ